MKAGHIENKPLHFIQASTIDHHTFHGNFKKYIFTSSQKKKKKKLYRILQKKKKNIVSVLWSFHT